MPSGFNIKRKNYVWLTVVFILGILSIIGSGGSGDNDGGGDDLLVFGQVLAPGGQIALEKKPSLLNSMASLFFTSAHAMVTGLLPVDDGTQVDLARINDAGTIDAILASTTTTGGRYSFNLTQLGVNFSNELVVLVAGSGTQTRAFVISKTVDITPVSESAVRLVFEQIASTPGSQLQYFTNKELRDVVASIDLLTEAHDTAALIGIEATVAAIISLVKQDNGIIGFLASAAEDGQTTEGPGDVASLFPLANGDTWNFLVDASDQSSDYFTATTVTGTQTKGNIIATVISESNVEDSGRTEEKYLEKNSRGITFWGNNDPDDFIIPQLTPYQLVNFPFTVGASDEVISMSGLHLKEDLDGDGLDEIFSMTATVTNMGKESITLPMGSFPLTFRLEADVDMTITLSSDNANVTVTSNTKEWLVPGIGPVKTTVLAQAQVPGGTVTDTETTELVGFHVNGSGRGVLPTFTVAGDLATASSNTETPGQAGIGSDGSDYLVVTCREAGASSPSGVIGVFVSDTNTTSAPFHIAQHPCYGFSAAVAYDGERYLVIFQRYSGGTFGSPEIFGVRVTPSGSVLDTDDGFPISTGGESQFGPAVAFDGTNFLVVYGSYFSATSWDIYGARVSSAGGVLDEFPITSASGNQDYPSIAFDGDNYMVVWEDGGDTLQTDVYGARISPAGEVLDPSGIAIATAPGYQGDAQITFDGVNYFVVWRDVESFFLDPPESKIYGRRIITDGTLLDGLPETNGIAINTTALSKGDLAVAFNGENYFVVWRMGSFSNDPPSGVYAARLTTAGELIDGPADSDGLPISGLPPDYSLFIHPTILFNGTNSLLTWVNNIELSGSRKNLEASFIYPF